MGKHHYKITTEWTGNKGSGTLDYRSYSRDHLIFDENKETKILGSSDSAFSGDPKKYNPEDLLIASLSSCHMLWYLHLCADHQIIVTDYIDEASGTLEIPRAKGGRFKEVTLNPKVTIANKDKKDLAMELHKRANEECFIANSCSFPIHHEPTIICA